MPALSKKQQKFMGIVRSIQKGEQPASKFNKDAQDVAKDMKKKDVKDFASTKHKGLPMKKEILGKLKEMIRQELSEYTYGSGDIVKDVNPTCPHFGAEGKVKSVNPKSVVFVVTNKGDNFEPGMELEKSHDQMKKIGESINVDIGSGNVSAVQKGDDRRKKIATSGGDSKIVKEMSAKTKKIINKLGKKEKEMFMDMVDMMGFDQVMADYKRDKKAFKQALKDMSESVITEKFSVKSTKDYINNLDQAINLIVRQANNLKGPLAKHPIKRNVNKLKAVQTMLKKGFAPALYAYEKEYSTTNSYKAIDLTMLKKKLQDGKFKSAVEYSLMPAIDTRGYDSNSFYYIKDKKEDKLRERLVDVLRDLVNKMDKAQLESVEEGFGGELNEKDKKKFEKERVENAEVLGYELTGVKDVNENINENKVYKVGDTISLLSFDRRHRGKAKVKSVSKSRANKFGIKNHYITNKGTFTDMEVEGTEAYKLRFKGNTEKQVTKAMNSPYGVILPESINEDGHTDVASSKRKVMIMVQDSNKLLNKLNGMNKEDSLPSWWSDKITLSQNYLQKATNYLLNPVESVNENLRPSDKKILMVIAREMVTNQMKGKNKNQIRKELPNILSTMGTNDFSKKPPTSKFNKNKLITLGKGFGKLSDYDKKVFVNTLMYNAGLLKVESVNEAKEPEVITQLRDIVKRKTNKKIKDPKTKKTMRVDMFTASAITQVYDAVKKTSHKSKFESLPLDKMAQLSFKMIK